MHLSTKKLAFLGLLLAVAVVLIILSGIFEFNTLFLLAAASFCVGIAFRESGIRVAFGFYFASLILGVLLAPNKLYCVTYAAMGFYLLSSEFFYDSLQKVVSKSRQRMLLWLLKYLIFNLMYLPAVFLLPKLFYSGTLNGPLIVVLLIGGQLSLYVFDKAYQYFQGVIWEKIRRSLKL